MPGKSSIFALKYCSRGKLTAHQFMLLLLLLLLLMLVLVFVFVFVLVIG